MIDLRSRILVSAGWIAFGAYLVFLGFFGQVSGHNWGGDFALYIEQARNIAEGRSYDQVKYVWGALNQVSPPTYPVGLPLLLAPIVGHYGLALGPMFMLMSVLLIGYFAASFFYFRQRFSAPVSAALTLVIALNPFINAYKNAVLSDLPFAALALVSLTLFLCAYRDAETSEHRPADAPRRTDQRWLWFALGSGLALGLAGVFRVAAIAMFPAVLAYGALCLVRYRNLKRPATLIPWVVVSVAVVVISPFPRDSLRGYVVATTGWTPSVAWANLRHYWGVLGDLFPAWGYYARTAADPMAAAAHFNVRWIAIYAVASLAVTGLVRKLAILRKVEVDDLFLFSYLMMLASLALTGGPRYLLPVFPVYLGYFAGGIQAMLAARPFRPLRPIVAVVVVSLLAYASVRLFEAKDFHVAAIPDGPNTVEAAEMIGAVKTQTPEDAIIIFRKPTVLALYSGRKSTGGPNRDDFDAIDRWYREIGVTHLVEDLKAQALVSPYLAWRSRNDEVVWKNERFVLWKLAPGASAGANEGGDPTERRAVSPTKETP